MKTDPACRVCGKPMTFMGDEDAGPRWYCYKDDVVYLAKVDSWSGEKRASDSATLSIDKKFAETWKCACGREITATLSAGETVKCKSCGAAHVGGGVTDGVKPRTEPTQTVKFCKKCGNKLEFEDEFCDKCGAEQKKIVATASTSAIATAIKETSSIDRQQKTSPYLLIAAVFAVLILLIAGAGAAWYNSIPKTATFTIQVQSNTDWQGTYGSVGGMTSVDGSGNRYFYAQGTVVSAVFQMQTDGGTLTVSIVRDGMVLASQTTTAAYGVVSVSATSTQQAQAIQTMQNQHNTITTAT